MNYVLVEAKWIVSNVHIRLVTEIKSEGYTGIKEFELLDDWRTCAFQAAIRPLPVILELRVEMITFNACVAIPSFIPLEVFCQFYLRKIEYTKANTVYHTCRGFLNPPSIPARSYHLYRTLQRSHLHTPNKQQQSLELFVPYFISHFAQYSKPCGRFPPSSRLIS